MSTRMFIGVIADGNWKVAQYYSSLMQDAPDYQAEVILDCLKRSSDNLRNNLQYCKFITTFEEVTKEMIEEHPTLSPYLGASILNEIARCNGNTVYLTDSRDFFKQEISCRFAFVINYDTGKLTAYLTGDRFIYGEYDLDNLPDTETLMNDFRKFKKEHIEDINRIAFAPAIKLFRDNAISKGLDPDEAEREFLKSVCVSDDEEEE